MFPITVATLNSNDTSFTLVEWLFAEGELVPGDAVVAVVETSKAATELLAERSGILHILKERGREYLFNTAIGYLFEGEHEYTAYLEGNKISADHELLGNIPLITKAAAALAERYGLSQAQLDRLDKSIIRTIDVERLVEEEKGAHSFVSKQDAVQRAVAATVTKSHRDIPSAYVVMRFDITDPLTHLRGRTRAAGRLIGIVEAFVKCIGTLAAEFPNCFSSLLDDATLSVPECPSVGITFDVGNGLFVPVIRDPGNKSLSSVAEELVVFRKNALLRTFLPGDLEGGNITLSLNMDEGVFLAVPIIYPGQSCAVSLGSVNTDDSGQHGRVTLNVGLAYDHRVINGREATQFLRALSKQLVQVAQAEA